MTCTPGRSNAQARRSHAGEAPRELLTKRLASRGENFGHRTIVADDVNQKGTAQLVADALVRQQAAHVEEVARVLAIEGCHDLAL